METQKEFTPESALTLITGIHIGKAYYEESFDLIEFISGEPASTMTFIEGKRIKIVSKLLIEQYPWLDALGNLIKDFCNNFRDKPSFSRDFAYLVEHLFKAYPALLIVQKPATFPSPSEVNI